MNHGLVVFEDTVTHRNLLREAGEYAAAADADLLLLTFLDEESYEADLETLESIGRVENVSYGSNAVIEGAVSDIREVAEDVLNGVDVEFNIAVTVADEDERAKRVINAGDEYDRDHAFIVGRSRSPAGKAIFGDFAQRVILNFDGYVTTATS